jgi:hypothetical protein
VAVLTEYYAAQFALQITYLTGSAVLPLFVDRKAENNRNFIVKKQKEFFDTKPCFKPFRDGIIRTAGMTFKILLHKIKKKQSHR